MTSRTKKIRAYIKAYEWSNVFSMVRNNFKNPAICKKDFKGKLVVITGATSGIGLATARKYAAMGADLLCINRNVQKSDHLKNAIEAEFGTQCNYFIADLTLVSDMHAAASELKKLSRPIDVLIHNAGVFLTRKEITADGLEKVFAIHYLASFIINYILLEKLNAQNAARVILVNSEGHRFAVWGLRLDDLNWEKRRYSGLKSYGAAKTAQILSTQVFNKMVTNPGVRFIAMHPGAVRTETGMNNGFLYRWYKKNLIDRLLKYVDVSAEALYYLGVAGDLPSHPSNFYNLTTAEDPAPPAVDMETAQELWEISLKMGGLKRDFSEISI